MTSLMQRLTLLGICICLSMQAFAQAKKRNEAPHSNPYQLQLAGQADYRLIINSAPTRPFSAGQQKTSEVLAAKPHAQEIEAAARANNLDPALVHALIHVESRHHQGAVSDKGAVGLMQLMPATAQRFGVSNPESASANLLAGTRYLRTLLDLFDQRVDLALAAYNAGEGAVIRYGERIPPYRETQLYVPAVLEKYDEWRSDKPVAAPLAKSYIAGTRLDKKALSLLKSQAENLEEIKPLPAASEEN
jgi:soluble lytic murein transglycosylase-like protein